MKLQCTMAMLFLLASASAFAAADAAFEAPAKASFGDWLKHRLGVPTQAEREAQARYFQAMDKLYRDTVGLDFKVASETEERAGEFDSPTRTVTAKTDQGAVTIVFLGRALYTLEWDGPGSQKLTYERDGILAGGRLTSLIAWTDASGATVNRRYTDENSTETAQDEAVFANIIQAIADKVARQIGGGLDHDTHEYVRPALPPWHPL